jgi:hypothetical protein
MFVKADLLPPTAAGEINLPSQTAKNEKGEFKNMKSKIIKSFVLLSLVCLLLLSLASSVLAAPAGPTFKDIQNHWAKSTIEAFAAKGLISGYTDGTFRPNGNISRAEVATILSRFSLRRDYTAPTYTDISPGAWYAAAVMKASEYGLMQGSSGRFRPKDLCSRNEMFKIAAYCLPNLDTSDMTLAFVDNNTVASWAEGFLKSLLKNPFSFSPSNVIPKSSAILLMGDFIFSISHFP